MDLNFVLFVIESVILFIKDSLLFFANPGLKVAWNFWGSNPAPSDSLMPWQSELLLDTLMIYEKVSV